MDDDILMTELRVLRDYIREQYLDPHCLWPHEYQRLLRQANDLIDEYHRRSEFDPLAPLRPGRGRGGE